MPSGATRGRRSVFTSGGACALLLTLAGAPALLLAGCGSSVTTRPAVCELKAQKAIARDLAIGVNAVDYRRSVGSNGMPQCQFTAVAAGHKVHVLVNDDNGPQPYFRLLRTVDEASQIFGPKPRGFQPPQGVSGLGPFASWFPTRDQLMATNKVDLVTVTVTWAGAKRDAEVAVAHAAIASYLAHPHGHGNADDYP